MQEFSQSIALVIGIDAYRNGVPVLGSARRDAERLAEILADLHEFETILLLDDDATGDAIDTLLHETLPARLGPEDRMLFYFAGHGVARESDSGPNGYLLPVDADPRDAATFIDMPGLHAALNELTCRHMLIVLDSCFSGAFRWSSTRDVVIADEVLHKERYDRYVREAAWQVITSAAHDEVAADQTDSSGLRYSGSLEGYGRRGESEGAHSPFALALFAALTGETDAADVIADGVITATELYLFLNHAVAEQGEASGLVQTPGLWPLAKHDKGEFIFLLPGHELNLPPAPELTELTNPYKGLAAYHRKDAEIFFGRENSIKELLEHMHKQPFMVVVGASGTGKSSLVRAGVLPRLENEWLVVPSLRPGARPFVQLQRALLEGMGDGYADTNDGGNVEQLVARWCERHPGQKLLVCIDQYEELLTMTRDEAVRASFEGTLARLLRQHDGQFRLIITIRQDFEPQFDDGALDEWWEQDESRYVIAPMTQDELREVVEKPAATQVMYFKPAMLVDELINEVVATPGGLPLLSFALSEMYDHYLSRNSNDRAIEMVDYEAVGGVIGCLRSRADQIYEDLAPDVQPVMRHIMMRMVATDSDSSQGLARRRIERKYELDFQNVHDSEAANEVITQLSAARLIVEATDEDGDDYVEPAHDALVRAWDKLIRWLNDVNRKSIDHLRFRRNLTAAAGAWRDDTANSNAHLWNDGRRVRQLHTVMADGAEWMSQPELEFAKRSIRVRRRNVGLIAGAVVAIAASAVIAVVMALQSAESAEEAAAQRDRALSAVLAIRSEQSSDEAQLLYAVESYNTAPTAEARGALITALQNVPSLVINEADRVELEQQDITIYRTWTFPDGEHLLASYCLEDTDLCFEPARLGVWRATGEQVDQDIPFSGRVDNVLFNEMGDKFIVLGGEGGVPYSALVTQPEGGWTVSALKLTDARFAAGQIVGKDAKGNVSIYSEMDRSYRSLGIGADVFAVSPDGETLVVTGTESSGRGSVSLWSAASGKRLVHQTMDGEFDDVFFSPGGERVFVHGTLNQIQIRTEENPGGKVATPFLSWWALTANTLDRSLAEQSVEDVGSYYVENEGRWIAVHGSKDDLPLTFREVGHENPAPVPVEMPFEQFVSSVNFSPDGKMVVALSALQNETQVAVFDVASGTSYDTFIYPRLLDRVDFTADGGEMRLVHQEGGGFARYLLKTSGWSGETLMADTALRTVAFAPDNKHLVVAGESAQLLDLAGRNIGERVRLGFDADEAVFSADGSVLAIGGQGLWLGSVSGAGLTELFSDPMSAHSLVFSERIDGYLMRFATSGRRVTELALIDGVVGAPTPVTGAAELSHWAAVPDTDWVVGLSGFDNRGDIGIYRAGEFTEVWSDHFDSDRGLSIEVFEDIVAVGTLRGRVHIYQFLNSDTDEPSIQRLAEPLEIFGVQNDIESLSFDRNTGILAVASSGVELLNPESMQSVGGPILERAFDPVVGIDNAQARISPDGERLAIVADGEVELWQLDVEGWVRQACALVNRNLTVYEWSSVMGEVEYGCTCASLPPDPQSDLLACAEPNPQLP